MESPPSNTHALHQALHHSIPTTSSLQVFLYFYTATESRCRKIEKILGSGPQVAQKESAKARTTPQSPRLCKGLGRSMQCGLSSDKRRQADPGGGLGGCCHFMSPRRRVRVSCCQTTGWVQSPRLSLATRTRVSTGSLGGGGGRASPTPIPTLSILSC